MREQSERVSGCVRIIPVTKLGKERSDELNEATGIKRRHYIINVARCRGIENFIIYSVVPAVDSVNTATL